MKYTDTMPSRNYIRSMMPVIVLAIGTSTGFVSDVFDDIEVMESGSRQMSSWQISETASTGVGNDLKMQVPEDLSEYVFKYPARRIKVRIVGSVKDPISFDINDLVENVSAIS